MRVALTFNVREIDPRREPDGFGRPLRSPRPGELALPGDDALEEFDSPETISALASALEAQGHSVELLGYGEPLVERLLSGPRPDSVWNFAEGTGGGRSREARVPALLEMLDVPYTGSDPLTLAATLDKDCAKRLVAYEGIATPPWVLFDGDWEAASSHLERLNLPVFVKPAYEGSSKGILSASIIHDLEQLKLVLDQLWEVYRQPVLVEEFIDGDELTVGLVGNRPPQVLGVMRVMPRQNEATPFVYGLEAKRDWQARVRYECPARLKPRDMAAVEEASRRCWQALGCRDVSRFDFRLRDGVPYFLECNPLPGMSPLSGDLVILSGLAGIDFPELVARILQAAVERLQNDGADSARCGAGQVRCGH